jgi:hypothetical protein
MKTKGNIKTYLDQVTKLMGWDQVDLQVHYLVMPNGGEPDEKSYPQTLPIKFYNKKRRFLKQKLKEATGLKMEFNYYAFISGHSNKILPELLVRASWLEKELMPDSFVVSAEVSNLKSEKIPQIPKFLGIDGAYAEAYRFEVTSSDTEKDNYVIIFNLAKEKVTMNFAVPSECSLDEYKQIAKKLSKIARKFGFTPNYKSNNNI